MPPKKATRSADSSAGTTQSKGSRSTSTNHAASSSSTSQPSKKRKSPSTSKSKSTSSAAPPSKSARRSSSARSKPTTGLNFDSTASRTKTLQYLLSPACLSLVRPKDERENETSTKNAITYTNTVPLPTPFQELLAATILSRPISHALGQRSIRTLFNPPFELDSPRTIREAGQERVHEALEQARTQHKVKTAEGIWGLVGVVGEKFGGGEEGGDDHHGEGLEGLRFVAGDGEKQSKRGRDGIREALTKEVKGLGKTGVDIFLRRVQGWWDECFPFVDEKSKGALEAMGLPSEAEKLAGVMGEAWGGLNVGVVQGRDEEEKKRMAFVLLVERAVGAALEGKTEEVVEAIARSEGNGE